MAAQIWAIIPHLTFGGRWIWWLRQAGAVLLSTSCIFSGCFIVPNEANWPSITLRDRCPFDAKTPFMWIAEKVLVINKSENPKPLLGRGYLANLVLGQDNLAWNIKRDMSVFNDNYSWGIRNNNFIFRFQRQFIYNGPFNASVSYFRRTMAQISKCAIWLEVLWERNSGRHNVAIGDQIRTFQRQDWQLNTITASAESLAASAATRVDLASLIVNTPRTVVKIATTAVEAAVISSRLS